jgi:hypothetical protein
MINNATVSRSVAPRGSRGGSSKGVGKIAAKPKPKNDPKKTNFESGVTRFALKDAYGHDKKFHFSQHHEKRIDPVTGRKYHANIRMTGTH